MFSSRNSVSFHSPISFPPLVLCSTTIYFTLPSLSTQFESTSPFPSSFYFFDYEFSVGWFNFLRCGFHFHIWMLHSKLWRAHSSISFSFSSSFTLSPFIAVHFVFLSFSCPFVKLAFITFRLHPSDSILFAFLNCSVPSTHLYFRYFDYCASTFIPFRIALSHTIVVLWPHTPPLPSLWLEASWMSLPCRWIWCFSSLILAIMSFVLFLCSWSPTMTFMLSPCLVRSVSWRLDIFSACCQYSCWDCLLSQFVCCSFRLFLIALHRYIFRIYQQLFRRWSARGLGLSFRLSKMGAFLRFICGSEIPKRSFFLLPFSAPNVQVFSSFVRQAVFFHVLHSICFDLHPERLINKAFLCLFVIHAVNMH